MKNRSKKLSLLAILAVAAVSLASCGKKPEEIKRRYKIRKKEVSLHERTGLHRTHRCNHRSRQLGLDRILPPRPRRPDLRKHDVAEPHHLRGCRHLRPLPDLRLRKNFRPRTGTGVRTGTLSYTQRKAV